MRIAFVSNHSDPLAPLGGVGHGGQNVYVRELSRHLAGRELEVDVFTRRAERDVPPVEEIAPGARVVRVPAGPARYVAKEDMLGLLDTFARWVLNYQRERGRRYSLVHGHYYLSGLIAHQIASALELPFVQTFHSLGAIKRQTLQAADASPDERVRLERQVVAAADQIIATAPQEQQDLISLYDADPARIAVISCGVDLELFRPTLQAEARAQLGLAEDAFLIVFVGRMERRKGIGTLLRAAALLRDWRPGRAMVTVVVGGEPAGREEVAAQSGEAVERRRLETLVADLALGDRVLFTGGLSQSTLRYYYSAADVVVVPSYYEPFGLTALEALACGASVVASRVGGLKTTVVEGQVGLLAEPRDAADFAAKISRLLDDPELNARFRAAARPYVERSYSWSVIAREVAEVYRKLLVEASGSRTR